MPAQHLRVQVAGRGIGKGCTTASKLVHMLPKQVMCMLCRCRDAQSQLLLPLICKLVIKGA